MFRDIESALSWAYMMSSVDLVDAPAINRMCGDPVLETRVDFLRGLSKMDQQKQAQSIVQIVEETGKVDPVFRELLRAEFGKQGPINTLVVRVMGTLGAGVHRRRGVQDIIYKYCGGEISAREIRQHLRCDANQIGKYESHIYDVLDKYRYQAMLLIGDELVRKGLVRGDIRNVVCS